METTSAVRAALVAEMVARSEEICDEITAMTKQNVVLVPNRNVDGEWIRSSTRAHIDAVNHLLAHPEDLDAAAPPVGATSLVRELARRGFPLNEITRSYQLSNARWYQICTRTLGTLTSDVDETVRECIALSDLTTRYVDRMCALVAAEYEDERERWLRQEDSVRVDRVISVLRGDLADPDEAERVLGYRLRQTHVAAIAWIDPSDVRGDELIRAQRVIKQAASVTTRGRPFVVARDSRTVWAWLPQPVARLDGADLEQLIRDVDPSARLAVGEPAPGMTGFGSSHRQAMAAFDVGHASKARAVFPYRSVSVLAFLVADPDLLHQWLHETLGGLVGATPREEMLRTTLAAYLRCQQSATATSRELSCHKNTVLYRIRAVEQLLGRAIEPEATHLALALHAYQWLGGDYVQ